ncbi:MAG: cell division protein [Rhodospirillaceae bacterium]|nr:cell division protein [Rhodospirillaceae bacterium]
MSLRQTNLALAKDDTNRFLPWLIAFMSLLAILSVAGFLLLKQVSDLFEYNSNDTMTIQVPSGNSEKRTNKKVTQIINILRETGGVIEVSLVPKVEVIQLLKPWLGSISGSQTLPLPQIIDIQIDRGSGITPEKISNVLTIIVPDITVDDHSIWLIGLVKTLQSAELTALFILLLIIFVIIGTVIFTTRTGMGIHKQTIEVLHFVGAHDDFIARQFAIRGLVVGLQGGLIGFFFAIPILYLFDHLLQNLEEGLLPKAEVNIFVWLSVALVVPMISSITMLTARGTVLKSLKKML